MHTVALWDRAVVTFFSSIRTLSVTDVFIGVTELGSTTTITGLLCITVTILVLYRNYAYAAGIVSTVLGAHLTHYLLKIYIERPRPPFAVAAFPENGFSFPSGHTTAAMAFYGFCVYMLCTSSVPRVWKILGAGAGVLLILLIGFSRIILGVHYPTDVFAGLVLGGIFIALGARLERHLRAILSTPQQ